MARHVALRAERLSYKVVLPDGGPLHVLNDCSLNVDSGLSTAILGRSGSGKSTLLSLMGLLAPCRQGEIVIAGKPTSGLSDAHRTRFRREHLGFVFQSFALLQYLTVLDNVALPLTGRASTDRRGVTRRCMELLDAVGLSGRSLSLPKELSGGEQQRVAIARALINSPKLVLADEPTGSLDHESASQIMSLLVEQTRLRSAALVVVTHDLELADRLDRRYLLAAGGLTEST